MSAPLPIKKLKKLQFPVIKLHSWTHRQHCEDNLNQEDTHTDEEIACTSECCAHVYDKQGLTLFQPKNSSTIEHLCVNICS